MMPSAGRGGGFAWVRSRQDAARRTGLCQSSGASLPLVSREPRRRIPCALGRAMGVGGRSASFGLASSRGRGGGPCLCQRWIEYSGAGLRGPGGSGLGTTGHRAPG
jgi:hypothetical protein